MIVLPKKDSVEYLDYVYDWKSTLEERDVMDVISTCTIDVVQGSATPGNIQVAGKEVRFFVSGGVDGEKCEFEMTIATSNGRIYNETLLLYIVDI